ncbi:unnamed protein product, partial [Ectocarpus sp. 12 AP-2014]
GSREKGGIKVASNTEPTVLAVGSCNTNQQCEGTNRRNTRASGSGGRDLARVPHALVLCLGVAAKNRRARAKASTEYSEASHQSTNHTFGVRASRRQNGNT